MCWLVPKTLALIAFVQEVVCAHRVPWPLIAPSAMFQYAPILLLLGQINGQLPTVSWLTVWIATVISALDVGKATVKVVFTVNWKTTM
jgi:hypothetical protein